MAITFLNSTAITIGTAASTWSCPTHSSRLGGAAVMVGIGLGSSAVTVTAVTDNAGNSYALAIARPSPKPAAGAELWYALNWSSGSTRISVTLSANSSGSMGIGQFDGVSTANALLVTGSSAITSFSTSHGASEITPSEANALIVSFARLTASSVGTVTNLGGMTTWLSSGQAARVHGMYEIQGAASTVTGSFMASSRCLHASVIAAFSDTAVVGGWRGRPSRARLMGAGQMG